MLKPLLSALALAACATADAAEQTYAWSYTGFRPIETLDLENISLTGRFTVEDLNGDGVFAGSELKHLSYDRHPGFVYAVCPADFGSSSCKLDGFSYDPSGALA